VRSFAVSLNAAQRLMPVGAIGQAKRKGRALSKPSLVLSTYIEKNARIARCSY
jgi:hypothetical protein